MDRKPFTARRLFLCFAAGAAWLVLSMSMHPLAIAAWAAPVLLLRFTRDAKLRFALPIGVVTFAAAYAFAWRDLIAPPALFAAIGVVMFLPYLADRIAWRRLPPALAPLAFPSAWVLCEYGVASAVGTWLSVVHSQYGHPVLLQMVSLTGPFGVAFAIGLFASVVNLVWERGIRSAAAFRWSGAYIAAALIVLLYGVLRMQAPVPAATMRVAAITVANLDAFKKLWGPLEQRKPIDAAAAQSARAASLRLQERLFHATDAAARKGAKLVLWSEGDAMILAQDQPAFLARLSDLAKRRKIYLAAAAGIITPGQPFVQNRAFLVEPNGRLDVNYEKSHPTPDEASVPGNGRAAIAATPIGNIAVAICYDYDFPSLLRGAASQTPALLLDPAWDSSPLDPYHTHMSAIGAIATGAPLVRATEDGLSAVYDRNGEAIAELPASASPERVMFADVAPALGPTLYDRIGDGPVWLSLILAALLSIVCLRKERSRDSSRMSGIVRA